MMRGGRTESLQEEGLPLIGDDPEQLRSCITNDYLSHSKGRTWAIAVRRRSYISFILLNSGSFSTEK